MDNEPSQGDPNSTTVTATQSEVLATFAGAQAENPVGASGSTSGDLGADVPDPDMVTKTVQPELGVPTEHKCGECASGRPKRLNISTIKFHTLGHYPSTIRFLGPTDLYSTEWVSLNPRFLPVFTRLIVSLLSGGTLSSLPQSLAQSHVKTFPA